MGVINCGILGGFSGKVGSVVGTFVNGEAVIKSLPENRSKGATTPQQELQRQKVIAVAKFLKPILRYIQASFQNDAIEQSEYNAAFAFNVKDAISVSGGKPAIVFASARVAHGNLPAKVHDATAVVAPGSITYRWTNNDIVYSADASDIMLPLIYNTNKMQAIFDLSSFSRMDEQLILQTPPDWAGDSVAAFLAIAKADHSRVSNSIYLGTITAQ